MLVCVLGSGTMGRGIISFFFRSSDLTRRIITASKKGCRHRLVLSDLLKNSIYLSVYGVLTRRNKRPEI